MIRIRAFASLTLPLLLALPCPSLAAGLLAADGGFRLAIYDENYKRGLGAELGLVQALGPSFDAGLHLNYTHFAAKTIDWPDRTEAGGYLTAYLRPAIKDQPFEVRLGPHAGAALIADAWHADLGGDAQVVFRATDRLQIYGAFVPSYMLGEHSQLLVRVGLGVQFALTGERATDTGSKPDSSPAFDPAAEPALGDVPPAPEPPPEPATTPAQAPGGTYEDALP